MRIKLSELRIKIKRALITEANIESLHQRFQQRLNDMWASRWENSKSPTLPVSYIEWIVGTAPTAAPVVIGAFISSMLPHFINNIAVGDWEIDASPRIRFLLGPKGSYGQLAAKMEELLRKFPEKKAAYKSLMSDAGSLSKVVALDYNRLIAPRETYH